MMKLSKSVKVIGWLFSAIIIVLVVASLIAKNNLTKSKYAYYQKMELETHYWEVKCKVVDEVKSFMAANAPTTNISSIMLVNLCDEFDIDVRFVLAQGLIESHYGTKGLATKTNSVWNMGAYDGATYEQILGVYKYSHPNESIKPYLKKLKKNYLGNSKTEWDLVSNFVDLNGHRYATYEKYEDELKIALDRIENETTLGSLLLEYDHLKRDLNR